MDADRLALELAGEPVVLFAERALFLPRHGRLLIADLHLGKADAFRRAGIGLPRGGTAHDLDRLDRLLATTAATELVILGDVLHGAVLGREWQATWHGWRARHPAVRMAALVGNHDRALANAGLGIDLLGPALDEPPFALRHEPAQEPALHVLCGHLHPVIAIPGLPRRCPAFWLRRGMTVLPAFSAFTGGWPVAPDAGEGVAVCGPDQIVLLSATG